jgi:hypothetical protein
MDMKERLFAQVHKAAEKVLDARKASTLRFFGFERRDAEIRRAREELEFWVRLRDLNSTHLQQDT